MADSVQNKTLQNMLDDLTSFINGQVHATDSLEMWQEVEALAGTWVEAIERDIEAEKIEAEKAQELDQGMTDENMAPGEPEEGGDG